MALSKQLILIATRALCGFNIGDGRWAFRMRSFRIEHKILNADERHERLDGLKAPLHHDFICTPQLMLSRSSRSEAASRCDIHCKYCRFDYQIETMTADGACQRTDGPTGAAAYPSMLAASSRSNNIVCWRRLLTSLYFPSVSFTHRRR